MKNIFVSVLCISLILSCKIKTEKDQYALTPDASEIQFQVKTTDKDYLEVFEDGLIPWISIKNASTDIPNLIGKDEVVIANNNATVLIDYPLNNPVEIVLTSDNDKGFTRKELALKISAEYRRIYTKEETSALTKTTPMEERQGLINRNQTDGIYGIWGHDIDDLDLSTILITKDESGEINLELFIES